MNELEVLKKLLELLKAKNLPKTLLRRIGLNQKDIEDIALTFDEDYEDNLLIGFIYDNGYDASLIYYGDFDEIVKYL